MHRPTPRRRGATALALAAIALALPSSAHADFGIFNASAAPSDPRAGVHSNFNVHVEFASPWLDVRTLAMHLPVGLLGNPSAAPQCPTATFLADACPANTRVGTTRVEAVSAFLPIDALGAIYLITPQPGEPARLGIAVDPPFFDPIHLQAGITLRSDFGLTARIVDIPNNVSFFDIDITELDVTLNGLAANGPFMTNPTACGEAATRFEATAYWEPGTANGIAAFTTTECASEPFAPQLQITPASQTAGQPVELAASVLFGGDVGGRQQSHVRRVAVTLPEGLALSPGVASGAGGLAGCTDAQLASDTCPAASRVGSTELVTPLVGTVDGDLFLATSAPGQLLRLFVTVDEPSIGLRLKLVAPVTTDPATGRISTVLDDLPQVPFTRFTLRFRGGDHAVIRSPLTCGSFSGNAVLTPWSGTAPVTAGGSFTTIDCPAPAFNPAITHSLSDARAGARTSVTLRMTRPDGNLPLRRVAVTLPPGLTGRLASVTTRCSLAAAQAAACPVASRVGVARVGVGTGPAPLTLEGQAFLTDPVDGGIAGLAIAVPAHVGPLNLGTVVVLGRLGVRYGSFGIDVATQDLPTIVSGIPLSYRTVEIALDRSGLMQNATRCESRPIAALFTAAAGQTAPATSAYQPTGCADVPFAPSFALATEPSPAVSGQPMGLTATIDVPDPPTGLTSAHVRRAEVVLPEGTVLNPGVANGLEVCTDVQFSVGTDTAPACPAASSVGTVSLTTPLLGTFTGTVHIGESHVDAPLRLLLHATGSGLRLKLAGRVTADEDTGVMTTVFDELPEVPLSSLVLQFRGGDRAVLRAPTSCGTVSGTARLTPWTGQPAAMPAASIATIDCAPPAFAPTLSATLGSSAAGGATELELVVTRPDRHAELRGMRIALPPGLLARLASVPACSVADARAGACGEASRLGAVSVSAGTGADPLTLGGSAFLTEAVDGGVAGIAIVVPAQVGPLDLGNVVAISALKLRTSDFGVDVVADDLPRAVGGIPLSYRRIAIDLDRPGFLHNATSCAAAQIVGTFAGAGGDSASSSVPYQATDCAGVPFTPAFALDPATAPYGQPTAITATITVPALSGGRASSPIKRAQVTLPEGLTLNPSVGIGLQACTDEQFGAGQDTPIACPEASRLGTVSLQTPIIGTLGGGIWIGRSTEPNVLKLFVGVEDQGVRVKLVARASVVDAATDRLVTELDGLPPVPITRFALAFRGGDRAAFRAPLTCAPTHGVADLVPWSNPATTVQATAAFQATGCPVQAGFAPTLQTTASDSSAGASPQLTLAVDRPDGQENLRRMRFSLPPGLSGRIGAVDPCAVAHAEAGSCPETARVGTARVSVGGGGEPLTLSGPVFLTGPVDGGLAGLAIQVPAQAGPVDLGDVTVLSSLDVRPDLGIDVATRELPQERGGVVLDYRRVELSLDRAGFLRNPTVCATQAVRAVFTAADGREAAAEAPYTATGCAGQTFDPRLSATLGGAGETGAQRHPALRTVIEQGGDEAALRATKVTMPSGLGPDLGALGRACAADQATAGTCPAAAVVGRATAITPLLRDALSGPVLLVAGAPGALPSLMLDLRGPVAIRVPAALELAGGRMVAAIDGLPDVPITRFELAMNGGAAGVMLASRNLCAPPVPALDAAFISHGGATRTVTKPVTLDGCAGVAGATTKPKVSATLSRVRSSRPSLVVRVRAGARRLRSLKLTLPKALRAGTLRRAVALGGGRRLKRGALTGRRRTLSLGRLPKAGVTTAEVRLRRGALRRVARIRAGRRVTLVVAVRDVTGRVQKVTVRVVARR